MKLLAKLAVGAAMIGGLAMTTTAPADAGVVVHIGTAHGYCYYHRCGHPVLVRVGPYYWHGRHWHHRRWSRGVWVYY